MKKNNPIKKFIKDEKGQGMTEYGLILGAIGLIAVGAFATFGTSLGDKISSVTQQIFGNS